MQILENIEEVEELRPAARGAFSSFFILYKELKKALKEVVSLDAFLELLIQKTGYEEYLKTEYSDTEFDAKKENIDELINLLSTYK